MTRATPSSRLGASTIVAVVVSTAFVAALGMFAHRTWGERGPFRDWLWWTTLGFGTYTGLTAGPVVVRLGRPQLPRPVLLQLLGLVFAIASLVAAIAGSSSSSDSTTTDNDSSSSSDDDDDKPMGLGWAIFWTILLLAVYGACFVIVTRRWFAYDW